MSDTKYLQELEGQLDQSAREGKITAYRIGDESDKTVYLRSIGREFDHAFLLNLEKELESEGYRLDKQKQDAKYYLLSQDYPLRSSVIHGAHSDTDSSQELRPGSGILRFVGGVPKGPAGTLTCFLSSDDGSDIYLLAAGHVVSDFWKEQPMPHPKSSIYHNPKGFPSTNSTRSIGKMVERSCTPRRFKTKKRVAAGPGLEPLSGDANYTGEGGQDSSCFKIGCSEPYCPEITESSSSGELRPRTDIDVGIVSVVGEFEWKQRTTCYGTFGELPDVPDGPKVRMNVMKCGAEEMHWTYAQVKSESKPVWVYGPDGALYEFRGQAILKQVDYPTGTCEETDDPYYPMASFAVPGDSGTMVVDCETRRPVGMLIAGSILRGEYVMTPIKAIAEYWKAKGYVLLRA